MHGVGPGQEADVQLVFHQMDPGPQSRFQLEDAIGNHSPQTTQSPSHAALSTSSQKGSNVRIICTRKIASTRGDKNGLRAHPVPASNFPRILLVKVLEALHATHQKRWQGQGGLAARSCTSLVHKPLQHSQGAQSSAAACLVTFHPIGG